jgi:RimJ/RimL family protein N-acetyltransferase
MPFTFEPMDAAHAHTILTWRYDPPYAIYDIAPPPEAVAEVVRFFVDPLNKYYQIEDERGDFVAFCCFGWDAQVPGGDYSADALDVGLGVRPDRTGQGRGQSYVTSVLEFARRTFAPPTFRATIAAFNTRAQRTWQKVGFQPIQTFASSNDGMPFVIMTRAA